MGEEASNKTCHLGLVVEEKQEDGSYLRSCIGSLLPTPEACDLENIDEDCSGAANNIVYFFNSSENDCDETTLGVCKYSAKRCIER